MLLQFAPAVGTRQYDWNRKQVRCNDSSGDLRVISMLVLFVKTEKVVLGFQLGGIQRPLEK